MSIRQPLALALVLVLTSLPAAAQTATKADKSKTSPPAGSKPVKKGAEDSDLASIRQSSVEFVKAFNAGDSKAVAALWTKDGDYTNEAGEVFSGREAIENEYAEFFTSHKGAKIELIIDSLRKLGETAALEDGRVTTNPATPGTGSTKYMAVHVKTGGQWLLSTVRETVIETPSTARALDDLEWLIGSWVAEEHGTRTESVCRWVANKRFVERTYSVKHPDETTASGIQLIGYNPVGGHIQSWSFTSDGGHAVGIWTPRENGWSSEVEGTTGDGTRTTAVNLLTRLDDNAYSWQSVSRSAGRDALPDTDEIIVKRDSKNR